MKEKNLFNRNLDDKRYYCECIVYTFELDNLISTK